MSSIIGKEFQNKSNGEVIKVVSIDGNIAILENDQRISVERLLDRSHYGENTMTVNESAGNPADLMSGGLHAQLLSQIKGLDDSAVNRATNNDSGAHVGEFVNPVESHTDAQRKLHGQNVYIDGADSQHQAMLEKAKKDQLELEAKMRKQAAKVSQKIEGIEEEVNIPVNRNLEGIKVEGQERRETSIKMVEDVGSTITSIQQPVQQPVKQAPAVNPMFTKMKRTQKVNLKIDIEEMMPSKDLLKMLEEGFEDSVLDYLTEEIAGKVLTDKVIKSQIKERIHEYVYGKTRKAPVKKPAKKTTTAKK